MPMHTTTAYLANLPRVSHFPKRLPKLILVTSDHRRREPTVGARAQQPISQMPQEEAFAN